MQKTENVISKSIFNTSALFPLTSSIFHQPSAISPQTSSLTIIQTNV